MLLLHVVDELVNLVGVLRVERRTSTLSESRSNQLSYTPFLLVAEPGFELETSGLWAQRATGLLYSAMFSSGGGIRTHDLWVMSPTSYQTALPRNVLVPRADAL
jgi:hypothetical protein